MDLNSSRAKKAIWRKGIVANFWKSFESKFESKDSVFLF